MQNELRLQKKVGLSQPAQSNKKRKFQYEKWVPYLFLTPTVFLIMAFMFYPLANVFYYSLQNYNLNTPFYNGFVGLENFVTVFSDPQFYSSLKITAKWVVSQVGLQLVFGMVVALILNQSFKFRALVRAAAFTPWAISGVLASVMWSLMYNEHMGVINDIFQKLGLIEQNKAWLADSVTVFASVVIAELWRGIPFFAITLLAGLQSIPEELYEAAKVDGAGKMKTFWYITLPQLKNTIVLTTLLRTVWEFNNIDLIFNLTGGGPAHQTTTLTMYIAELAVHGNDFGYGSALTVVSFGILLIFAVAYLKITRYEKEA